MTRTLSLGLLVFAIVSSFTAAADTPLETSKWPAPHIYRVPPPGTTQETPATQPAPRPAPGSRVIELTVRPAPEPEPALKYRLLPTYIDLEPGNAALLYHQAWNAFPRDTDWTVKNYNWLTMPPGELPREEVAAVLKGYAEALRHAEAAAHRETCDWEVHIRKGGIATDLPHLARARSLARVLALKARLEVADGRCTAAIRTLQTGFALARHVPKDSGLVGSLVGMLIARMMADVVQQLQAMPDAPNLYWTLADLPRPLIPIREAMQIESDMVFFQWPELRPVAEGKRTLTAEEWAKVVKQWGGQARALQENPVGAVLVALRMYPEAKRALIAGGRSPQEVEAMPVAQVIAIHQLGEFVRMRDDLFKWFGLPYWQAREGLAQWNQELQRLTAKEGSTNALLGLLPALDRALFVQALADRQLAALQCIEGIRMYAAAHEGKPPDRLDLMTNSPAPIDPVTGKPFNYAVDGQRFTIDCPAPPGLDAWYGIRYVVTVRK